MLPTRLKQAIAFALISGAAFSAAAQSSSIESNSNLPSADSATTLETIEVKGKVIYRDRTEAIAPTLSYDLEYFQQFEPLTVGDMLKRVPSVAFLSDVLEYDGVRLRGLDPEYTQVLINGERVPGAGFDRAFFVDRIPAELVERIEILRSGSANRSGDAIAGALNIVLRDGYSIDGGFIRLGALHYDDGVYKPTFGAVWGGEAANGQLLLGVNVQGRRNPKDKFSQRFSEPAGTLDDTEIQTDVRSGTDYSFNADYSVETEIGEFNFGAFYVATDRYQDERSVEYRDGIQDVDNRLTVNDNDLDIDTGNYALDLGYKFDMLGGESKIKFDFAGLRDEQFEFEDEYEFLRDAIAFPEDDRFTGDQTFVDIDDRDVGFELSHERDVQQGKLEFGVQLTQKDRETEITADRNRITIPNAPAVRPIIPGTYGPFLPVSGGDNSIEEDRIEPFVQMNGEVQSMQWELGLRYEQTDVEIEDRTVTAEQRISENNYGVFLPSAHLRWNLSNSDRIHLSIARNLRRPNFNQISPALLLGELGDNDFIGNPALEAETAWGFDTGYETRLGKRGIMGINVFYRDIKNLIEIANTGIEGDDGPGSFVLQPRNSGDGQVWGAEFDLSTPLSVVGLDNTGIFFNYSWLDSEIKDLFGTRRFNNQSNYVFNLGFIQDLSSWESSFGLTFRQQGRAFGRIVGEEVRTEYDGDLEAFVEKRLNDQWTIRLTGSNLLNASKDEIFDKFNTIEAQILRDYDEFELETETGGRVYQLVTRFSF